MLIQNGFCRPTAPIEREFAWHEANAIMANAIEQVDFLRAADAYHKLIERGAANGILYYNLGAALLQAGHPDAAQAALLRAEQYLGSQPDITKNLKIACARKLNTETAELPWYRIALFWHFILPAKTRALITVTAFLVFWLALTIRRFGIRRGNDLLIGLSLLIFVSFSSSLAVSMRQAARPVAPDLTRSETKTVPIPQLNPQS